MGNFRMYDNELVAGENEFALRDAAADPEERWKNEGNDIMWVIAYSKERGKSSRGRT